MISHMVSVSLMCAPVPVKVAGLRRQAVAEPREGVALFRLAG